MAVAVAAIVVALAMAWYSVSHTRPSYDAFGWLVWGRQVLLHWNLNTDGAPSWKPLTFLFTLPYAAFGRTQMSLWAVTASAAAFSAGVFAGRIAYRLAADAGSPPWAALAGGVFAAVGVVGMNGYSHQVLIATSDPMVVALCLAAVDAHLSGRPRLAFAAIVLAALGRPEAWPFAGLYAIWAWRAVPTRGTRILCVAGILLIPAGWFVIPALTSRSWFISGALAMNFPGEIHGNKLVGVTNRFLGLYELPMQLAWLFAALLALWRRDRTWLALIAAAIFWLAVELAFALHGWPASQRYMMEAAAVLIALAGAAVGCLLGGSGLRPAGSEGTASVGTALRLAGIAGVIVLLVALVPVVRSRANLVQGQIVKAKLAAERISALGSVVAREGGGASILSCGKPVTLVGYQSTLAWYVGLNVGDVGYRPGRAISKGYPIVVFKPASASGAGWTVHPIHMLRSDAARCARLRIPPASVSKPRRRAKPPPGAAAARSRRHHRRHGRHRPAQRRAQRHHAAHHGTKPKTTHARHRSAKKTRKKAPS